MTRLDPLTELGCRLKRPIHTGEPLLNWLFDKGGLPVYADALLREPAFSWEEIAISIHDLTRGMWSPTAGYLFQIYKSQGGSGASFEEAA